MSQTALGIVVGQTKPKSCVTRAGAESAASVGALIVLLCSTSAAPSHRVVVCYVCEKHNSNSQRQRQRQRLAATALRYFYWITLNGRSSDRQVTKARLGVGKQTTDCLYTAPTTVAASSSNERSNDDNSAQQRRSTWRTTATATESERTFAATLRDLFGGGLRLSSQRREQV